MPCTRPLKAWKLNGKIQWVQPVKAEGLVSEITLPCGRCIGCRLIHAQEWATRITHESRMHDQSAFVTLTYAPEHIPPGNSLRYRDFQLFMKRLRKDLSPRKIRYYVCGEYGEQTRRPHYHCVLFGYIPPDGKYYKQTKAGTTLYTSDSLEARWQLGNTNFSVFEPAAGEYIARYITKKITGEMAQEHYQYVDESGKIWNREPEFGRSSSRPGIGAEWWKKYGEQARTFDAIGLTDGRETKLPRYYNKLWEREDPEGLAAAKKNRVLRAREKAREDKRAIVYGLEATEAIHNAKMRLYKRDKQ